MVPTKYILKFIGIFLGSYILLILVFHSLKLDDVYKAANCSFGTFWFNKVGNKEVLYQFEKNVVEQAGKDIGIYFMNKQRLEADKQAAKAQGLSNFQTPRAEWGIQTWLFGLLPSLFMAALIIAGPLTWKRKLISLLVGLFLLHLFLLIRLHLEFTNQIALHDWLSTRQLSSFFASTLELLNKFLYVEFTYVVAFLIWILVTFRKSDFDNMMAKIGK